MAEFDSVSKSLISTYPNGFLEFLLGHSEVQMLDLLNPEQPIVETQVMDSLLRVQLAEQEVLVHCEFQTTDSTGVPMPRRMASYMGYCFAEYGLPLLSHVIYLRPDAGRHDPGEYVQEVVGYEVVMRYKVLRLISLDGAAYLSSGNVGVLPFTPLMGRPEGMAAAAWLRRCVETTEGLAVSRSVKESILAHMGVLSSLVCEDSTIFSFISEEIMNDFPLLERFRQQGLEQGLEQGREGLRQSIRDTLAIRFDRDLAQALSDRLAGIEAMEQLQVLLHTAIQVSDPAEFTRLIDEMIVE